MSIKSHPTIEWFNQTSKDQKFKDKADNERKGLLDNAALRELARQAGADDCGIADIMSPALEDEKDEILSLYPETKSVISFVTKMNRENVRCVSRDVSDHEFRTGFDRSNSIASKLTQLLLANDIHALSPSAGFPMDVSQWPGKMWKVSHKLTAVAAGMGHLGHNRLLIHPDFGNFIVLGTLLIDTPSNQYNAPLEYNPCINCGLCVSACPVGAVAADGSFSFVNCMVHNYRDRMGGFSNWVENIVKSKNVKAYRESVPDTQTVSMWQSLSYGICNKSSYCMAVCPAGKENIGEFLMDKKSYRDKVLKPLQDNTEAIFVLPDSDALDHVSKKYPHKQIKTVGSGVRPASAQGFIESLPLVFQKKRSKGINVIYGFTFIGDENVKATVAIKDKTLTIEQGHTRKPDISITADASTWLKFLSKEKNLIVALITRKIKIKGSPALMKDFAKCFPL